MIGNFSNIANNIDITQTSGHNVRVHSNSVVGPNGCVLVRTADEVHLTTNRNYSCSYPTPIIIRQGLNTEEINSKNINSTHCYCSTKNTKETENEPLNLKFCKNTQTNSKENCGKIEKHVIFKLLNEFVENNKLEMSKSIASSLNKDDDTSRNKQNDKPEQDETKQVAVTLSYKKSDTLIPNKITPNSQLQNLKTILKKIQTRRSLCHCINCKKQSNCKKCNCSYCSKKF